MVHRYPESTPQRWLLRVRTTTFFYTERLGERSRVGHSQIKTIRFQLAFLRDSGRQRSVVQIDDAMDDPRCKSQDGMHVELDCLPTLEV